MLEQIGTKDKIPEFIQGVKAKKHRLMGFGHRVYKSYDPRAKILKQVSTARSVLYFPPSCFFYPRTLLFFRISSLI